MKPFLIFLVILTNKAFHIIADDFEKAVTITYNSKEDDRLVGGSLTKIQLYPFVVSIQYNNNHCCGGSIIDNEFILTAAHCIRHKNDPKKYSIRAGSTYHFKAGVVKKVCKCFVHNSYKKFDYDVAVLKLCSSLRFTDTVLPVLLPNRRFALNDGDTAEVLGWGIQGEKLRGLSKILQRLTLPITPRKICERNHPNVFNGDRMICAGSTDGGKDACQGDSGGPLVLRGIQVGIVSWGKGCARPGYSGIYANVSYFRDWISGIIKM